MHKSIQCCWIEHAEAKSYREHAALWRTASEPHVNIVEATTDRGWSAWRRALARVLGYSVAAVRSLSAATRIWATTASRAAFKTSPENVDYDRVLVAVVITDIVDSTKWAAKVGDRDWGVLLDRHRDATRYQIKRFGGREVGNRGDGFVGIFDSPSRAVRCASAIADTIAPLGISLRSGIHAGEVHLKGGEISGIAVHIAARLTATAHPGEACVSGTVHDLVAGSGLVFEDRGIHRLRGLPDEIHLYAMPLLDESPNASVVGLELGRVQKRPWQAHAAHSTPSRSPKRYGESTRVNPGATALAPQPADIKVLFLVNRFLGERREEARAKYQRMVAPDSFIHAALAWVGRITDIDFSSSISTRITTNGEHGSLDKFAQSGSGKTLRQLALERFDSDLSLMDTPDEVADSIAQAMEWIGAMAS